MDGIRTCLETSTIHGLTYISTTRKHIRLFWTFVVLAGFSTAGYLIQQSFQSWAESPVKTTVETLPISEITFPKITVCPPRNTFTDLNYDLMAVENVSLAEIVTENITVEFEYDYILGMEFPISGGVKTKSDELFEFASEVINNHVYFDDWMMLEEENRFFNWYHGYTKISDPKYTSYGKLKYYILTSATRGVISTKNFGEKINEKSFSMKSYEYTIEILTPKKIKNNKNVTLHLRLEFNQMIGGESKYIQQVLNVGGNIVGNKQEQTSIYHFKLELRSSNVINYIFSGSITESDYGGTQLMPGFRVRWWYSGAEAVPEREYLNSMKTQNLRRYIQIKKS